MFHNYFGGGKMSRNTVNRTEYEIDSNDKNPWEMYKNAPNRSIICVDMRCFYIEYTL